MATTIARIQRTKNQAKSNGETLYCICLLDKIDKKEDIQCCECQEWFHKECVEAPKLEDGECYTCLICSCDEDEVERLQNQLLE